MNKTIQISVDTLEGSHQKIEAVVLRCSIKTVLLKFYQNSQETTRARVSQLIRSQAPACGHRLFPANFGKYSEHSFIEHLRRLLLKGDSLDSQKLKPGKDVLIIS